VAPNSKEEKKSWPLEPQVLKKKKEEEWSLILGESGGTPLRTSLLGRRTKKVENISGLGPIRVSGSGM
jgi:hypothetical protein